jgi:CheY-like chemotaxis protein
MPSFSGAPWPLSASPANSTWWRALWRREITSKIPASAATARAFPLPDLIVSDLKMPGHTGLDFLDWIKMQSQYRELPFVMFSGSALPHEREMALKQGARAFFSKSGDFTILKERVRQILSYLAKPGTLAPGMEAQAQNINSTLRNIQSLA